MSIQWTLEIQDHLTIQGGTLGTAQMVGSTDQLFKAPVPGGTLFKVVTKTSASIAFVPDAPTANTR